MDLSQCGTGAREVYSIWRLQDVKLQIWSLFYTHSGHSWIKKAMADGSEGKDKLRLYRMFTGGIKNMRS